MDAAMNVGTHAQRDIWAEPAPAYPSHLPGLALPLRVVTRGGTVLQIQHEHLRILHAIIARLVGPHNGRSPDFSLLCSSAAPSGWGLYVRDAERGRALAGHGVAGEFFGEHVVVEALSCATRFRSPPAPTHRSIVRVDAFTPIVIRADGGAPRDHPSASSIWNALTAALPARLGVVVDRRRVKLQLLAARTEPAHVDIGGKIADGGVVTGWHGNVVLEASPIARWLLECASRIGLGGRTAFGFGCIAVEDLPAAPDDPPPPPEQDDLIARGVASRAAALWGITPADAHARLMQAIATATLHSVGENGTEMWDADGLRLVCVPWLGDQMRVVGVRRASP
jgi:hypothetical protein